MRRREDPSPYGDARYLRVIGWLVGKGLLFAPDVPPLKSGKLKIKDVLWVAENAEPRVFEILPSALLHYPASFMGWEDLPPDLLDVLSALKWKRANSPDFRGIPFHKISFWADYPLPDRRLKPISQRKIMRSFRLAPDVIQRISHEAAKQGLSEAEYLERLVRGGLPPR